MDEYTGKPPKHLTPQRLIWWDDKPITEMSTAELRKAFQHLYSHMIEMRIAISDGERSAHRVILRSRRGTKNEPEL